MGEGLPDLFEQRELMGDHSLPEDLFSILETLEDAIGKEVPTFDPFEGSNFSPRVGHEALEAAAGKATKKRKLSDADLNASTESGSQDAQQQRMGTSTTTSHITVERNRRKQMNEHLTVLRSLMPCFYAKRVMTKKFLLFFFSPAKKF